MEQYINIDTNSNYSSHSNGEQGAFERKLNETSGYTQSYRMSDSSFDLLKTDRLPLRFERKSSRSCIVTKRYPDHFRIRKRTFTNGKSYLFCDEDSSDYDESDGDDRSVTADREIILKIHVRGDGLIEEEVVRRFNHRHRLKLKKNATRATTVAPKLDSFSTPTDDRVIGIVDDEQVIYTSVGHVSEDMQLTISLNEETPTPVIPPPPSSRMSSRLQGKVAVDYTKFFRNPRKRKRS